MTPRQRNRSERADEVLVAKFYPVRSLLLISALATTMVRGGEATAPTVREKLHAKIMASLPPAPPPKPSGDQKDDEKPAVPPILMKPVVVSESKLIDAVAAGFARDEQNRRDERFTAFDGGTITSIGPMKIGGWWSPAEGWTFLRLNKTPTPRQISAAEARIRELYELASFGQKRQPSPAP